MWVYLFTLDFIWKAFSLAPMNNKCKSRLSITLKNLLILQTGKKSEREPVCACLSTYVWVKTCVKTEEKQPEAS